MNLTATADVGIVNLGAYATYVDFDKKDRDMRELTLEVAKSFGPLDTGLYYVLTKAEDFNDNKEFGIIQVYLTYNF
jgi:hypothetical protein